MIETDNTNVALEENIDIRDFQIKLKQYQYWLNERNIKHTLVYWPVWHNLPTSINMRNEDALVFKLTFGL